MFNLQQKGTNSTYIRTAALSQSALVSAISGDTVVVGYSGYVDTQSGQGGAFVYSKIAGVWSLQQTLVASDPGFADYFGTSVDIDGDNIIVGAPHEDGAGNNRGAAYVFTRTGTVWTEQQKITATTPTDFRYFGNGVSIKGNTCVIGETGDGAGMGSASAFTRSAGNWTLEQTFVGGDVAVGDYFGNAVSYDSTGDSVVIGSRRSNLSQGAAYVFTRAGGIWTEEQKLTASDGQIGDAFGGGGVGSTANGGVALDGDTCAIGALSEDGIGTQRGAAYVFTRTGTVWTEEQKIVPNDPSDDAEFGNVSLGTDVLVVGAHGDGDFTPRGAAYVFTRNGTVWTQQHKLSRSRTNDDGFGVTVAYDDGGNLVVSDFDGDGVLHFLEKDPT